jgi:hypothetical protein
MIDCKNKNNIVINYQIFRFEFIPLYFNVRANLHENHLKRKGLRT